MSTHAYFDTNSPLDSGIVLTNNDILTARDVIRYRLQADLVVLSASQTGMATSLGGDELAGLAQAFLQAGARSLIVSLWTVDDYSTASLMTAFYSNYRAKFDKAQALSQAMTHIREQEKWQHPYYWAPFVLIGEW
jgi:CHAT domain-containing protein